MAPLLNTAKLKLVSPAAPENVSGAHCLLYRKINRSIMEHFRKFNVQLHLKLKELKRGGVNGREFHETNRIEEASAEAMM